MAFNNSKSNSSNKVNTTTKVIQMYNSNGEDAGTLTLGFWNTYATLKINPALEPRQREQGKMYNYDVQASVVVNAEALTTLYQGILKMEKEVASKGTAQSVAIKAGQYVVKVGLCTDYEGMDGKYYLGLFEVDNKNVATGSMFYVFTAQDQPDNTLMFDWNEETGESDSNRVLNSQWIMFKNFIKMSVEQLVSGGAHGSLCQTNIWISKVTNALDVMRNLIDMIAAGKGGSASVGEPRSAGGFGAGFGSGRKRNSSSSSSAPTRKSRVSQVIQEEVVDNVDDILKEFGGSTEFDPNDVDIDDL